jgi:hypothetical protein
MHKDMSERRLVENEVFFRQANEKVANGLKELEELARLEGQPELAPDGDQIIQFYCECSDEKCRKRIGLTAKEYRKLHQNRDQFIVLPGHSMPELERTVKSEEKYVIVEKYLTAPEKANKMHPTDLDHN